MLQFLCTVLQYLDKPCWSFFELYCTTWTNHAAVSLYCTAIPGQTMLEFLGLNRPDSRQTDRQTLTGQKRGQTDDAHEADRTDLILSFISCCVN